MKAGMLTKIISGGQSGVDQAALDVAISQNIPHGGFCPLGRKFENGIIPHHYQLRETESTDYAVRTKLNVLHSDGTLILTNKIPCGGTLLTFDLCKVHGKPVLLHSFQNSSDQLSKGKFSDWLSEYNVKILNIAGDRESQGLIYGKAFKFLQELFKD